MALDHIGIAISDGTRAREFYSKALAPLGITLLTTVPPEFTGGSQVHGFGESKPDFWIHDGSKVGEGVHVAFVTDSRAKVDAFHAAALAAGAEDNGAPGIRAHYHPNYYGAFVRDADGVNVEAVCHQPG